MSSGFIPLSFRNLRPTEVKRSGESVTKNLLRGAEAFFLRVPS